MIAHQFHTVHILFFALFMQLAQLYMYKDSRNLWIRIINNFMYSYVILCVHVRQFVVITTKQKFFIIVSLIKHYQFLWPSDLPFQTQCSCAPQTYHIQQTILGRTVTWSFPLQSTFPVFKATTCMMLSYSKMISWKMWISQILAWSRAEWQTKDVRPQGQGCKCDESTTKQHIFQEYILL